MHILITIIHVVMCIVLILIVLLQTGKGADIGAAFGGSSQTIFGSSGPGTFLGKMTTVIAIVFMLTSLWLAYFASHKGASIVEEQAPAPIEETLPQAPAQPAPTAPAETAPVLPQAPQTPVTPAPAGQ